MEACVSADAAAAGVALGQLLRRYRRASGWNQEELAEHAGVGVRTICDLECGRRIRPYPQTMGSLAAAFGLRGPELDEFVRLSRQRRGPAPYDGQMEAVQFGGRLAQDTAAGQFGAAVAPRQLPAGVSQNRLRHVARFGGCDHLRQPMDVAAPAARYCSADKCGSLGV
jgi:transcriptional regulator with XRE-family HTH domain